MFISCGDKMLVAQVQAEVALKIIIDTEPAHKAAGTAIRVHNISKA